jgi:hypothetical protein
MNRSWWGWIDTARRYGEYTVVRIICITVIPKIYLFLTLVVNLSTNIAIPLMITAPIKVETAIITITNTIFDNNPPEPFVPAIFKIGNIVFWKNVVNNMLLRI